MNDRRSFWRIVGDLAYWPFSMLGSKHDTRHRHLSQFRVVLFSFAVAFIVHWPDDWTGHDVAALAILVFALPLGDLFARVPVAESVDALAVFFSSRALGGERPKASGPPKEEMP